SSQLATCPARLETVRSAMKMSFACAVLYMSVGGCEYPTPVAGTTVTPGFLSRSWSGASRADAVAGQTAVTGAGRVTAASLAKGAVWNVISVRLFTSAWSVNVTHGTSPASNRVFGKRMPNF